jgi:hypothetical protein
MRKFSNIQEALDFAAANQDRLTFPFNCRCNGSDLKVLSPELARTTDRDRPTLVVTRRPSSALELGYVVSKKALEELLQAISSPEGQYRAVDGEDRITVICHDAEGIGGAQFTFPLARRIPEFAAQEGDFVLLLSRPQNKEWKRFWLPLETRLLHSTLTA